MYALPSQVTCDTKHRIFQDKLLHNILHLYHVTNKSLRSPIPFLLENKCFLECSNAFF